MARDGKSGEKANDAPMLRQWNLLRALDRRQVGADVKELADELGVTVKTIRRDLELFHQLELPIEERVEKFGRKTYSVGASWAKVPLTFTFDEALALHVGRRLLEPFTGAWFWDAAQRAMHKIQTALGPVAVRYLDNLVGRLHFNPTRSGHCAGRGELIDQLLRAIEESKQTIITYQPLRATEPVEYEIHPYGMSFQPGAVYVVAYSRDRGDIRHFKIDRLAEVEVSDLPFRRPADWSLERHLAGAFGIFCGAGDHLVRVRFLPAVVRRIEEGQWHPSQRLTRQRDGSLIAEFRLSATNEILGWLLSFAGAAVVLDPPELREQMRDAAERIAQTHLEESKKIVMDPTERT